MTKAAWLDKADKAIEHYQDQIDRLKKRGKPLTTSELNTLGELQKAVGSVHGRHEVTYGQALDTVTEMQGWVNSGTKDSMFS